MEKNYFRFEEFDIRLETQWVGRSFYYFDEGTSSNSILLKDEEKFVNGAVVLVEDQSEGRGRLDRSWESFAGQNLTFSLLLTDTSFRQGNPPLLSFVASLAVARALDTLYQLSPNLKWPNDVLVKGRKICGILLEASSSGSSLSKIVIGIGINVNQPWFKGEYRTPPTSLKMENDKSNSREVLLAEVLNQFEELTEIYLKDPEKIIKEWKQYCNDMGEKITIDQNGRLITGTFEGIDKNGCMLLEIDGRNTVINYGDVSIVR